MIYFTFLEQIKLYEKKFYAYLSEHATQSQRQIKTFGVILFFNYPLYYFIWKFASIQSYESLSLRIIASLLCVPLIFYNYWGNNIKKFFPIYWYITAIFCLPFFFLFMTFNNHGSMVWLLNLLLEILLTFLIFDLIEMLAINAIGFLSAWILYRLIEGHLVIFQPSSIDIYGAVSTIAAAFVIGSIFAHNKQIIEKDKLRTAAAIGASLAHELRTPLSTIDMGLEGAKKYFPVLLENYRQTAATYPNTARIPEQHLSVLSSLFDELQRETHATQVFIDILLYNANQNILENHSAEIQTINSCLETALTRYPFTPQQKNLLQWHKDVDFAFRGSSLLVTHTLFNLIKNALYQIEQAGKGEIIIWGTSEQAMNVLHFKDTATGIPAYLQNKLFQRFVSGKRHGTGLGLAFCKMVMQGLGGDIKCVSSEGEFTEFFLFFPKIN